MNIIATTTTQKPTPDDSILFYFHPELRPGPELQFSVACGHCRRECEPAETEAQAIGRALGLEWYLKIPAHRKLDGFFNVSYLGTCEMFCPRCYEAEFQSE